MPGHQGHPVFAGGRGGLGPAGGGVVVGQGDDVEARRGRGRHHRGRRLGAVGNVRVGMQVDPHLTSLVDGRPNRASGRPAPARARCWPKPRRW